MLARLVPKSQEAVVVPSSIIYRSDRFYPKVQRNKKSDIPILARLSLGSKQLGLVVAGYQGRTPVSHVGLLVTDLKLKEAQASCLACK